VSGQLNYDPTRRTLPLGARGGRPVEARENDVA
jgi:hypothetical protein